LFEVKRPKSDMIIYGKHGMKLAEHKGAQVLKQEPVEPMQGGCLPWLHHPPR
jgi:hypothetical protein